MKTAKLGLACILDAHDRCMQTRCTCECHAKAISLLSVGYFIFLGLLAWAIILAICVIIALFFQ